MHMSTCDKNNTISVSKVVVHLPQWYFVPGHFTPRHFIPGHLPRITNTVKQ